MINKENFKNFLIKEKKSMFPIEPDLVIDFYLSIKIFIINDIAEKCKSYFNENIILFDAAVENDKGDIPSIYKLIYFKEYTYGSTNVHIYTSKNNELFISEEFAGFLFNLLKKSPNPIEFRWVD